MLIYFYYGYYYSQFYKYKIIYDSILKYQSPFLFSHPKLWGISNIQPPPHYFVCVCVGGGLGHPLIYANNNDNSWILLVQDSVFWNIFVGYEVLVIHVRQAYEVNIAKSQKYRRNVFSLFSRKFWSKRLKFLENLE